jgi:molecular chaperone GrpE
MSQDGRETVPRDPERDREPDADGEREDIEILEVVGLDEALADRTPPDPDEVEVVFETEAPPEPEAIAPADAEVEALQGRLLRVRADFDNYKKRVERDRADAEKRASASLVARLLPVLDNFERALVAPVPPGDGAGALRDGLILIHRQLLDELRRDGLCPVDSLGQPFDPNIHEAVATDAQTGLPPGIVVEELQKGYFLLGRLLRPALVRVSVPSPEAPTAPEEPEER